MAIKISNNFCNYCKNILTNWDYRYKEEHYCRICYEKLFILKTCLSCNKIKRIYRYSEKPLCKFCEVKDLPCNRCGKTSFKVGKILKNGVVCNSCIKYYQEQKICTSCNQEKINVSKRTLTDGSKKLLCGNCYNKTLPICSSCGYRRVAYSYDKNNKTICKICSIEIKRKCISCHKLIPAGYGNICKECNSLKTLNKKTFNLSNSLSKYLNSVFIEFSNWLLKRRNSEFTALNIQHYYGYFFILDEICLEFKRLPTYEEIVSNLTVRKTREYLLVTIFLNEMKIITINNKIKEEYANLDMIDKYLNTFKKGTRNHSLIEKYYLFLLQKLDKNQTTIRSIRLALTPAVKFLNYCENFKNSTPSNYILEGYLWCYGGQKATITGFINFLQKEKKLNISIKNINSFDFIASSTSKEILKERFLDMLRRPSIPKTKEQYLYKIAISYLHNIEIPKNVYINKNEIKQDKNDNFYLVLNKHKLFIGKFNIFKNF